MIPAELRQARRQSRAADAEADGSARRSGRRPARLVELRHFRKGNRGLARVRVFGIDPGSERTGYGCVETDGSRHRIVVCGAISSPALATVSRQAPSHSQPADDHPRRVPAGVRRDRERLLLGERAQRAQARTRARRGDARGGRSRRAGVRIHAGRNQARRRRLRPRRQAAGAAHDQAAARPRRGAVAARRRRRAGGRDLPRPRAAAVANASARCSPLAARATSWRTYKPART